VRSVVVISGTGGMETDQCRNIDVTFETVLHSSVEPLLETLKVYSEFISCCTF